MPRPHVALYLLAALILASCSEPKPVQTTVEPAKRIAPLLTGLGTLHHPVTTQSPEAQRFFDQGLILAYAFNHAESERSFQQAALLDPGCAMAFWGVAFALGPNINAPIDPEAAKKAYNSIQAAQRLAPKATPSERAYIAALAKRYAEQPVTDRAPLDSAYADAMRQLVRDFPDDLNAATLLAQALMDLHPWDYWSKESEPRPWTPEILNTIESVLKRDPNHPGAIHFYIHALEASKHVRLAEPYADRLPDLVPAAGHLVHMPGHIYIHVGRYHDAVLVNLKAIEVDKGYITQCRTQNIYPLAYVPHNQHFLWSAASMEGNGGLAIKAALATDASAAHCRMRDPDWTLIQQYTVTPLFAYVRFGKWAQVLDLPAPGKDLPYPAGLWHYARGRAFIARNQPEQAAAELAALEKIMADPALAAVNTWGMNPASKLLPIAQHVLAGELAAKRKDFDAAVSHLRKAVDFEYDLNYNEPVDWDYPVRHSLGAVLLEAGRPAEAQLVYEEDLELYPENGWSLFGLAQSLKAQGKYIEAEAVNARFKKAWAHADVTLTASRF